MQPMLTKILTNMYITLRTITIYEMTCHSHVSQPSIILFGSLEQNKNMYQSPPLKPGHLTWHLLTSPAS